MDNLSLSRRTVLTAAVAAPLIAAIPEVKPAETLVKSLYDTLSDKQKKEVCFAWDHMDKRHRLLRTRTSNNWRITPHSLT